MMSLVVGFCFHFTLILPQAHLFPLTTFACTLAGNYQSGISVVDFTNPAAATEIAYADPATLVDPDPPVGIELGGDWSTYWYNGLIYESDITRGLIIWNLSDNVVAGARKFGWSNPQTQETSFPFKGTAFGQ